MIARSNIRRPLGLAALALVAAYSCTCGGEEGRAPAAPEGRVLEPLPPPPPLRVDPEAAAAEGPLTVVAARPQGDDARGELRPTITFGAPVVALGAADAEAPPPARIEPPVAGEWRWLGSASVEFVPARPLPYATSFRVTVPAGLRAIDGSTLEQDYSFEFSTPAPTLQQVQPPPGFRWLPERTRLTLLFDQPVLELGKHARLEVDGRGVPLRVAKEVAVAEELRARERGRRHERADEAADRFRNRQTRYELEATEALPADAEVVLVIDGALRGAEGPRTLGEPIRRAYRTRGPLRILSARACPWGSGEAGRCPWGPLVLLSTNELDVASLKGRLELSPPAEIDWDDAEAVLPSEWSALRQPHVVLPGRFRPGTTYRVKVAAGAKDVFGQVAPAFEGEARTDDRAPQFDAGSMLALIESEGDGTLPIETVNLRELAVSLWGPTPAELARALARMDLPRSDPAVTLSLDVSAEENRTRWTGLDVRRAFGGAKSGLFVARIEAPILHGRAPDKVFGQVTDLAVHAKLGATSGVVWVTRLSSGASVGDAALTLYDRAGGVRWQGRTDAEGLARVPGLAELIPKEDRGFRWEAPFALIAAEQGGELGVTLSTWQDGLAPAAFDLPMAWDGSEPKSSGLLFTDRGIYRPGDAVHLKGVARFRRLGRLEKPAAGTKVAVLVRDPRNEPVARAELEITRFGTFAGEVRLPPEAALGTYALSADAADGGRPVSWHGSFRVEEYRAPQFRVDASLDRPSYVAGEPIAGAVLARYLFGGAMSDADVRWTAQRSAASFTPPGNGGFSFGAHTWWWDDGEPGPSREVVGGGEAKVDEQGALRLALGAAEAPAGRTWEYVLEAEVADVNRQRVASRARALVHPAALYAGVRETGSGFAEVGREARLELIAARPDGAREEGAAIAVAIVRREWKSIRKKGAGGEWFTTSEVVEVPVASCELRSGRAPVPCAFVPREPGFHTVSATVTDAQGREQTTRTGMYVVGSGWVSWQRNDTDRIDLVPDKTSYEPGETARILVKSPYPEAEALLTVERAGVSTARRLKLDGSATTLEVPIGEEAIPNVFVGVVLVRGRVAEGGLESGDDPGRPAVKVGYAELKVEERSKRLSVEVIPDAKEKRPRDRLRVKLRVRDHEGRPAAAEVVAWAVDEGVLRLTGYERPDPIAAIFPPQGLSVRIGEPLLHLVQRRLYGEKGSPAGGGGGDGSGAGFRSRFVTTPLFAPALVTDANGEAEVELELPDNLTTYRIMAVAVTEADRFGGGEAEVRVAKPLLALPALPRVARAGDRFEAGVVVHTHGFAAKEVRVRAAAEGVLLEGPGEQRVELAEGRPTEVRFRFAARDAGRAVLRFSVEGGGERDGVEQSFPVVLPVAMEAVAAYGDTKDERIEALAPPGGTRPGVGGLELTLASTALGGFDDNLDQLVEYPYGCLEQSSSRLVPFVALRELFGRFGVPWKPAEVREWIGEDALASQGSADPDEVVRRTVRKIEELQNHDGGYRYWPSSGCSAQYASAYAVLALGRAKEVGFPVDAKAFARGQAYLANEVAAGACERCGFGCTPPGDETRVFALWALARTGAPKPSYYGELYERRGKLPLFGRAMLADAMFMGGGDRARARALLDELLVHAKETAAQVHFEEVDPRTYAALWSSDTRTSALVLLALADIAPDHPYVGKLARHLGDVRGTDGRYRNTQEAAFSLMALAELTRTKEREAPDFTATVTLGGRELAREAFDARSLEVRRRELPSEALGPGGKLAFRKEGPGVLYYGARLRYAPAALPLEPLDRGFTVQRWFEPYGGGGQARRFYAGELVRVRVRVAVPAERHYAVVSVPLPAGLEAVDTTLASTAALPEDAADEGREEGYEYESAEDLYGEEDPERFSAWAQRFYSPFGHTERRDDRVVLFADRLPPGVHVASFVARATTPGTFVLPPAQAEEMYAPEVFGRSDGGELEVLFGTPVAAR